MKDTVILKSGKWTAGVNPRLGGNLISLSYDGKDVLRPLENEEQLSVNPYIQGAPILLPANRTYLGKFSFEGVEYTLPINEPRTNSHLHGLVHRQPFAIIESSETSITMEFINTDGKVYPFDFRITATYSIDEEGLSQRFEITNIGKSTMPYTFCLHTTFKQPDVRFTFPLKIKQEAINDIPTGRYVELSEVEKKFVTGSPAKDVTACGYYLAAGHTVTVDEFVYTVSDNFDHWITWNAHGKKDYICLEPQAGKVNGLNIDDGHVLLKSGETHVYTTRFTRDANFKA